MSRTARIHDEPPRCLLSFKFALIKVYFAMTTNALLNFSSRKQIIFRRFVVGVVDVVVVVVAVLKTV